MPTRRLSLPLVHNTYMGASSLARFVCIGQERLQFYIRSCCSGYPLRTSMESADSRLISRTGYSPACYSGLVSTGLTCLPSHAHLAQLCWCYSFRKIKSCCVTLTVFYAGLQLTCAFSNCRSWASNAQIVRAILLANATVTTFGGRRLRSCSIHASHSFARVSTERAP